MWTGRRENLGRVREIGQVAARHGFGWAFGRTIPGETRDPRTRGRRLRAMLDELGPTFVKFGQLLSTRPDLLPPDVVSELRTLQDHARPVPFDAIRGVVETELGCALEDAFAEFSTEPLAAASIGQVHTARLVGGAEVVVKVQRPGAERTVQADVALMYQLAGMLGERVRRLRFVDLAALVGEFDASLRRELDYGVEGRALELFRESFRSSDNVRVPAVHWDQSTTRVLVMERLPGTPLSQLDLAPWSDADRRTLAARISHTWLEMVFEHGHFHADPHPANIIVEGPDRIGLIDFGMVGQLSARDREAAIRLLVDVMDGNAEALPRRLRALGVRYPQAREQELADHLGIVLRRYADQAMGDIDARALVSEIFATVYSLDVTLPSHWMLLDKTLATLAGVALEVSPAFDVFALARPYATRVMAHRLRPDRLLMQAYDDAERYAGAFREYPFQVADVLEGVTSGTLEGTVHIAELDSAAHHAQASINRVALAIVSASLFVSSAMIATLARGGPDVAGLALAAGPPFVVAAVLAGWVAAGVVRSRRW